MNILAIDPGNEQSAYVVYETAMGMYQCPISRHGYDDNAAVMRVMLDSTYDALAIEMVANYGMAVGREVFETVYWIGRFCERWGNDETLTRIYRREVKMHLCGCNNAKDANVRQALIDRFGPGKDKAIGRKASPGPLYGISGDCWSALAVAVTYADTKMGVPA